MLELADIETDPEERRRLLTFFVAGGGFSGTELAGELADFVAAADAARVLRDRAARSAASSIVHPGPTLLPELYGSQSTERQEREAIRELVDYAMRHARKLGVELMLETKVVGATPNEVYLSNGEHVPTRTIVSAVGTKPPPLLDDASRSHATRAGGVVTDDVLRVDGRDDLWAGGDCAAVPHPRRRHVPARRACTRSSTARSIGHNLRRALPGRSREPFRSDGDRPGRLDRPAHGGRRAEGLPVPRHLAWVVWRCVLFAIFPSWDRRLRLLADWSIWPLVGRDIVQMRAVADRGDYECATTSTSPAS